jgi:hypothetical protein
MRRIFVLFFIFAFASFQVFSTDLEALKKEVENLRNLKFKEKIKFEYVSERQISEILKKEMTRQFSSGKLENYEVALKVFWLIPKKSNLKSLVENLMSSQAAGIYDPKSKKMYILEFSSEPEDDEFFQLTKAMNLNEIFIVHELDHAITDQNFDLERSLKLENIENEDRQTAALAVAEGDATMVMMKYLAKTMNLGSENLSDISEVMGNANFYGDFLGTTTPRYLRETLIFAYTEGLKFVNVISKGSDTKKIDNLYHKPPESTEEIIHPEKYLNQNDKPKEVKISLNEIKNDVSLEKVWEGTWGELGTKIILEEWGADCDRAAIASSGWGGDRYIVYKNKEGEFSFFWKSVWDSEKDAKEFEETASLKKEVMVSRKGNEVIVMKRKEKPDNEKSNSKNKLQ